MPRPLTQLRLSSLTLAKTSQPSPARGEGNKGRETVGHFLRLSPSGLSRGSRAGNRAIALDARDKPEHDNLFGVERSNACRQGPLTQLRLSSPMGSLRLHNPLPPGERGTSGASRPDIFYGCHPRACPEGPGQATERSPWMLGTSLPARSRSGFASAKAGPSMTRFVCDGQPRRT